MTSYLVSNHCGYLQLSDGPKFSWLGYSFLNPGLKENQPNCFHLAHLGLDHNFLYSLVGPEDFSSTVLFHSSHAEDYDNLEFPLVFTNNSLADPTLDTSEYVTFR